MSVDDDWECFMQSNNLSSDAIDYNTTHECSEDVSANIECTPLNISTKTNIIYLNTSLNLEDIFWKIPVLQYSDLNPGVIKKQIKLLSLSTEQFEKNKLHIKRHSDNYVDEYVIYNTNRVNVRQDNFKDERKVSIGISKKDILTQRVKQTCAFYNCFVIIVRLLFENEYREMHVKAFNTGKIEIPGTHNNELFKLLQQEILNILQPYYETILSFDDKLCETILINSNFNAGFNIKREALSNILRMKYNISVYYDPCSYPGIQCKYKMNQDTSISFMIFRTGSVLIVGKCTDDDIYTVYNFIKDVLKLNYSKIVDDSTHVKIPNHRKNKKVRKRTIYISN